MSYHKSILDILCITGTINYNMITIITQVFKRTAIRQEYDVYNTKEKVAKHQRSGFTALLNKFNILSQ